MIFLFALVEPDKVTKAALNEEFVTESINLTFLPLLIPPCVPDLRTFEQQEFVCDVMRWICMIRLFYTPGCVGGVRVRPTFRETRLSAVVCWANRMASWTERKRLQRSMLPSSKAPPASSSSYTWAAGRQISHEDLNAVTPEIHVHVAFQEK